MKTSNLIAIMACALTGAALADGYVVEGYDFSGDVSGATRAEWNKTGDAWPTGVTVENNAFTLDNDLGSALTLTPTDKKVADVVIKSTAKFTANESASDLPVDEGMSDAQAGVAVVKKDSSYAYYGFVKGAKAWAELSGATPDPDKETTIKIEIGGGKVKFSVVDDETVTALTPALDLSGFSQLNNVACFGTGSLKSIDAQYTYATVSEAIAAVAGVEDGQSKIKVDGATGTAAGQVENNGLKTWQCAALGIDGNAQLKPIPTDDADTKKITLKMSGVNVTDANLVVKYQVKKDGAPTGDACDAEAIKIPLENGKYIVEPVFSAK